MKKFIMPLLFLIAVILIPFNAEAKEINAYLFYGEGCPHCSALEEYLNKKHSDDIKLYKYEVWNNTNNQQLWKKVQEATGETASGVPYFIVGEKVVQGYMEGASEDRIDNAIALAKVSIYNDNAGIALGLVKGKIKEVKKSNYDPDKKEVDIDNYQQKTINVPLIGTVDLSDLSIPLIAIIIGLVDGFNPCAMWILLFLITMLFNYPSRKKMWILGSTFLFTSAFVYFLFMISFLNIATFVNGIDLIRLAIAGFATLFGCYNLYRFINTKEVGCDVVDQSKRKKIMTSIKKIVSNKKFILSLLGIILLACSVNLIELFCSLGLPVMFTEILAYNNITGTKNILYIILYILFFLLDDLIIFFIAMKTLKITAISNKYTKYSHLIGGLIMIAIGLLMVLKPEWLMFNF